MNEIIIIYKWLLYTRKQYYRQEVEGKRRMLDANKTTYSISTRKAMQEKYGATTLPLQELCHTTYTFPNGETRVVDVIGTDECETQAILSALNGTTGKREIWHAYRDQTGTSGTWRWTEEQLEAARKNPVRISDDENDFADDERDSQPIQIAPIHKDRRIEILMLGLQLGKTNAEVQEQLRKESLDDALPANYRTEQGELDLLKNWLPQAKSPSRARSQATSGE